jgi:hypothetical protein
MDQEECEKNGMELLPQLRNCLQKATRMYAGESGTRAETMALDIIVGSNRRRYGSLEAPATLADGLHLGIA